MIITIIHSFILFSDVFVEDRQQPTTEIFDDITIKMLFDCVFALCYTNTKKLFSLYL